MSLRFASAVCLLLSATGACAQRTSPTSHAPLLGSAWYPEQWPESRWDVDLSLMEKAHFHVVRVGEFAWSALEPREGQYDLDWLARAIALAAKHHLAVVIGTPTDAPPAWLTTKYPETLGMNADGHIREHGGRRQFNYADPKYRALCRDIVSHLAERFGHDPAVIGWQIGNEYTDESFDPATRAQFQHFLHAKYGSLANLNQRWATAYWSQTYTAWDQIPLETTEGNPGLLLEHKHFVTATWRSFQRTQIDALRPKISEEQFVTTNIGGLGWSDNWDHGAIAADLDLASWDDYVGMGHLDAAKNAMLHDFARGWKRRNFWVMETQPGSVNWALVNNSLDPGETRALAWQAVGHGADAVLYWQWRSAPNGQEQYHGAIVGPSGRALPLYPELQQLGEEFEKTAPWLAGTEPLARVALLHTYDSRWAIDFQQHSVLYDQEQVLLRFYQPLQRLAQLHGEQVDIVDPTQATSLVQYRVLIAPSLNLIDDVLAAKLLTWVKAGGTLLLGPRSGMKNAFNGLDEHRQPGPFAEALGGRVEQFYALDAPIPLQGAPGSTASIWGEDLAPLAPGTRVLLRYGDSAMGWLNGHPAMLATRLGNGTLMYLGTIPDEVTLRRVLTASVENILTPERDLKLPAEVELCVRRKDDREVAILINHGSIPALVSLSPQYQQVVPATLQEASSTSALNLTLPPQGVAVLWRRTDLP